CYEYGRKQVIVGEEFVNSLRRGLQHSFRIRCCPRLARGDVPECGPAPPLTGRGAGGGGFDGLCHSIERATGFRLRSNRGGRMTTVKYESEKRLAVVMYGGVPLAIYIGGVAKELLSVVRATAPATPGASEPGLRDDE